jgi:putative peptidoglycan lipid II flippase
MLSDDWYQSARYAEQALWYPEIPADEAPDARAHRRAAYADAVDATRFNLPLVGPGFLDPAAVQQLFPPRRGPVQGPATRPAEPAAAPAREHEQARGGAGASRASRIMALGTIASRVTGLVRSTLLVSALGALGLADAFNIGNSLPNMVSMIVIGGAVNAIFVPQLVRAIKDDGDGGQGFIDRLLTMTLVLIGGLTLLAFVAAPQLITLYAGSMTGAQREVAIMFARYCLPQILFYGLTVMLGQILNAKDSFGPVMWTPVLANVVQIATIGSYMWITNGVIGSPETVTGAEQALLGLGTTLGIVLQALTLTPYLHTAGVRFRPRFDWRGTGLGKSLTLAKWSLLAVLVSTVVNWAVTAMVTKMGTRFPSAGVGFTAYSNAITLWVLPQSVVTVSIVTALLPRMSRAAHADDRRSVGEVLSYSLRATGVLIVPCAFAFLAFGQQIVSILLGHGNMTPTASASLGHMLMAFSLGLIPYSAQFVMLRGFYAYEDSKSPFFISLWIGVLNVALALLAFLALGHTRWGVAGICAAYALSYVGGMVLTAQRLRRRVGSFDGRRVLRVHVKLCVSGGLAAVLGGSVGISITDAYGAGTVGALAGFSAGGALFVAVFLLAASKMRVQELSTLMSRVKGRLRVA